MVRTDDTADRRATATVDQSAVSRFLGEVLRMNWFPQEAELIHVAKTRGIEKFDRVFATMKEGLRRIKNQTDPGLNSGHTANMDRAIYAMILGRPARPTERRR